MRNPINPENQNRAATLANSFFNSLIPVMVKTERAFLVTSRINPVMGLQFKISETTLEGREVAVNGWSSLAQTSAFVYAFRVDCAIPANVRGY